MNYKTLTALLGDIEKEDISSLELGFIKSQFEDVKKYGLEKSLLESINNFLVRRDLSELVYVLSYDWVDEVLGLKPLPPDYDFDLVKKAYWDEKKPVYETLDKCLDRTIYCVSEDTFLEDAFDITLDCVGVDDYLDYETRCQAVDYHKKMVAMYKEDKPFGEWKIFHFAYKRWFLLISQ